MYPTSEIGATYGLTVLGVNFRLNPFVRACHLFIILSAYAIQSPLDHLLESDELSEMDSGMLRVNLILYVFIVPMSTPNVDSTPRDTMGVVIVVFEKDSCISNVSKYRSLKPVAERTSCPANSLIADHQDHNAVSAIPAAHLFPELASGSATAPIAGTSPSASAAKAPVRR